MFQTEEQLLDFYRSTDKIFPILCENGAQLRRVYEWFRDHGFPLSQLCQARLREGICEREDTWLCPAFSPADGEVQTWMREFPGNAIRFDEWESIKQVHEKLMPPPVEGLFGPD